MPVLALASLLWGRRSGADAGPGPQVQVAVDPVRSARIRCHPDPTAPALVEAAEKALEADDEETAAARSDEADVLTADWSLDLLKQAEVQGLLQRLKEVRTRPDRKRRPRPNPGSRPRKKWCPSAATNSAAELELVRSAERGATYDYPIDLNDKVLTWVNLSAPPSAASWRTPWAGPPCPAHDPAGLRGGRRAPDLAYLAVIESGFRNEAKSRAKAVGMWQFIRSTGRIYGLSGNAWVEERRDPIKATRAAARYLSGSTNSRATGTWRPPATTPGR